MISRWFSQTGWIKSGKQEESICKAPIAIANLLSSILGSHLNQWALEPIPAQTCHLSLSKVTFFHNFSFVSWVLWGFIESIGITYKVITTVYILILASSYCHSALEPILGQTRP